MAFLQMGLLRTSQDFFTLFYKCIINWVENKNQPVAGVSGGSREQQEWRLES